MATYNKNPGGGGKRPKPKNPPRTPDKFKGIKPAPMPNLGSKYKNRDPGITIKGPTRKLKPPKNGMQPLRSTRKK
jgi:hypothetical protein